MYGYSIRFGSGLNLTEDGSATTIRLMDPPDKEQRHIARLGSSALQITLKFKILPQVNCSKSDGVSPVSFTYRLAPRNVFASYEPSTSRT